MGRKNKKNKQKNNSSPSPSINVVKFVVTSSQWQVFLKFLEIIKEFKKTSTEIQSFWDEHLSFLIEKDALDGKVDTLCDKFSKLEKLIKYMNIPESFSCTKPPKTNGGPLIAEVNFEEIK